MDSSSPRPISAWRRRHRSSLAISSSTHAAPSAGPMWRAIKDRATLSATRATTLSWRQWKRCRAKLLDAKDVERGYRPEQALELHLADRFDFDQLLDRGQHAFRDQNLTGLGLAAQTRGKIRDGADRTIVQASLETHRADRRVALRDAGAEIQLEPAFAPLHKELCQALSHRHDHAHGTCRRVWHLHGIVEKHHHAVAGKALERAFVRQDHLAHLGVVLAQHAHDLFRLRGFRKRRE